MRLSRTLALFLILASVTLYGQDKISVESSIDKQTITIGDRVDYTVKITADTSLAVDSLPVGAVLGEFEIKDYKPRQSTVSAGLRVSTESYELTTFTTGDYKIPALTIRYRTPAGEYKYISTDPIPIKVNSLLTGEESEDVKPLKPTREFKPVLPLWWIVGGALLLILIIVFIILYRRAKRPIDLAGAIVDTRLPWEIALDELGKLRDSDLVAKGEYKLFYLRLSEIFRAYLERRYGISALERTTDEIIREFRSLGLEKSEETMIGEFLDDCDLVKFAKYAPTPSDVEEDFISAKTFVIQTRSLPHTTVKEG
jgi:hypothetical protein